MKRAIFISIILLSVCPACFGQQAPAPLFRDPVYDGAADPVVIWNRTEKNWWMLYTARRANQASLDVAYCYATNIGVASSDDNGKTWIYRGELELDFEKGKNTFWAPDVIYHDGLYHMFVVYIRGARNHWGGTKSIHHYTSDDMWNWKHVGALKLSSDEVIDATLIQMKNGTFRIWYKDEKRGSITMMSESQDLYEWKNLPEPAIGGGAHEGPKVFEYKNYYWMLTDEWRGLRVYRSNDLNRWEKQGLILDKPSSRPDDGTKGGHADVLVVGEKAYIFYFTHPGRINSDGKPDSDGALSYTNKRSSIQAGELIFENETLTCDRDRAFDFFLPNQTDTNK